MDPSLSRELLCKQAAALTVVMVSFVTTRLKRKRIDPEVEPDPHTVKGVDIPPDLRVGPYAGG